MYVCNRFSILIRIDHKIPSSPPQAYPPIVLIYWKNPQIESYSTVAMCISGDAFHMRVSFHATVREAAGVPETIIDADDVRGLLQALKEKFGNRLCNIITKDGELREDVVLLVNGQNIGHSNVLGTKLDPDDEVAIFPPVSGG